MSTGFLRFNAVTSTCRKGGARFCGRSTGVCRDYAHLAIAFGCCMNIPARNWTGYLGEPPNGPMVFSGWFEAYLDGHWYTFDPRNNIPRIGRALIARGRDADDCVFSCTFGPNVLKGFKVRTEELVRDRETYPRSVDATK
jgi:transglutaminase-like putative cysteine protease